MGTITGGCVRKRHFDQIEQCLMENILKVDAREKGSLWAKGVRILNVYQRVVVQEGNATCGVN